jgi:exodeoxyribonuclease-5
LTKTEFIALLSKGLGHEPTRGQLHLFDTLVDFLSFPDERCIFLLKGYAGTGKTTAVKAINEAIAATSLKTVLLAPTGRAAKVMAAYSGKPAYTVHKRIYFSEAGDQGLNFTLQRNTFKDTLFIVDEASMIGSENPAGENDLLDDIISYVISGTNCRVMFIGDEAQLPPVGLEQSPAMSKKHLESAYALQVFEVLLDEVMRQDKDSGILLNATALRQQLEKESNYQPQFRLAGYTDLVAITGNELEDALQSAYSKYGDDEVLVVTRSNKNALLYSRQIRTRIRWQEDELSAGDQLMVVRNNYYWTGDDMPFEFIANGDTLEIRRLGKTEQLGEYRFRKAQVGFWEYPDAPELEVLLLLNTLNSEQASFSYENYKELSRLIEAEYEHLPLKSERMRSVKKDARLNALHVKYAYAVTCHKAQGGQWKCVFIDQGFITEEMMDRNYLRWLYTALTRASEKVYLVNFNERFFGDH